ncbi:hypothetical protein Goari_003293, partial [Gossypium aridum]|nr:hypothetical protein [Gossypium aridum]
MARTIVIKLLGQRFAFNALVNKVHMLCKPKQSFQLMDLENDYYLVKFQDEYYHSKVLKQ